MHRGIHDRVVEQEQVLVGSTAAHVNLGTEIGTRDYTRERLDALDDIGLGKARHALDGLRGNHRFARLALGALAQLHHDLLEFGYLFVVAGGEESVDIDVFFGSSLVPAGIESRGISLRDGGGTRTVILERRSRPGALR